MHFIRFIRSLAPVDDRNDHDYCVVLPTGVSAASKLN